MGGSSNSLVAHSVTRSRIFSEGGGSEGYGTPGSVEGSRQGNAGVDPYAAGAGGQAGGGLGGGGILTGGISIQFPPVGETLPE